MTIIEAIATVKEWIVGAEEKQVEDFKNLVNKHTTKRKPKKGKSKRKPKK
jgi:hypothetical protein